MTYGQMRDRVLMLLNQYSIAGGKIRVTYNNQADYLARVPGAVNEALVYLATTARRLRSVRKLEEAERAGVWRVFALPEDCWQICSGGVFRLGADGNVERTNGFRLLGEDRLSVAGAADGAWMLEYFRYPVLLREKPGDGDLVDCPPECAGAVACYAAAQLAALDVRVYGKRVTPYGAEALVRRDAMPAGAELAPVSIEELFVLMVKGECAE